jgi:hypothetical protein
MKIIKCVFNPLEGNFQPIECDEERLNPLRPFNYEWHGFWFLVPNYMEEVGNA